MYQIGIKSNTYYEELAQRNTIKTEPLVPVRGLILDRNGLPLAVNRLGFSIALPPRMRLKEQREQLDDALKYVVSFFPELTVEKLSKIYRKYDSPYNHDHIRVVDFVSYEEIQPIYVGLSQHDIIRILPATKRFYPNLKIASHIVGYVGRANREEVEGDDVARLSGVIGKAGLEKQYNTFLQGEMGYRKVKVTALNKEIEEIEQQLPAENNNLVLSVDLRLQQIIHDFYKDKGGAAIVMDVHTGELLAAGSFPEYDINQFVSGISHKDWNLLIKDLRHPFTNKLINGLYPPGSVIKPAVGLAFMEEGIDPDEKVFCPEEIELGGRKFRDWKKGGHGYVDLKTSIKRSADVYYYKGSLKTGIEPIAKTLRTMGFGEKTGIDLPNEFIGVVPTPDWKMQRYGLPWYTGETLIASIGQGYSLVTPMQVVRHTGVLTGKGMVVPHLVRKMGDKNVAYESASVLNYFHKRRLHIVQRGMYEVGNVEGGTAFWHLKKAKIKETIASKTGTAQVVGIPQDEKERMKEEDMQYFHRSHAWLTGYVPYENPAYAITVLVEHGGHGGDACAPIMAKVVNAMKQFGYL